MLPALLEFCRSRRFSNFLLLADSNTHRALGERTALALKDRGYDLRAIILPDERPQADSQTILNILVEMDTVERVFLSVGSGSITDLARFVSHRTRRPFISLPTAASVDGYPSPGSPLLLNGVKKTVPAHPPLAIFADLPTLCQAPARLRAAGFGDILGKFCSFADWKLGCLLWDEAYNENIANRSRQAAIRCAQNAAGIGAGEPAAIQLLLESLVDSGLNMLAWGASHPASGAEHHLAHFWEMKLGRENRPFPLHGEAVGLAALQSSKWYAALKELSRVDAARLLDKAALPPLEERLAEIRRAYGPAAETIMSEQRLFLEMSSSSFQDLKTRALENWDAIIALAREVPSPAQMATWLCQAGMALEPAALGLLPKDIALGIQTSHYLRERFTISKFIHLFGLGHPHESS